MGAINKFSFATSKEKFIYCTHKLKKNGVKQK